MSTILPQSSMEGVLDFSVPEPAFGPGRLERATRTFIQLLAECEPRQQVEPFKKATLVRVTYENVGSKASFLRFFFDNTHIPIDGCGNQLDAASDYEARVANFADALFNHFFLPMRAASGQTPRPSPPGLLINENIENLSGTPGRVASLRRDCLRRDEHRCVITGFFDTVEAIQRRKALGDEARDDRGIRFIDERPKCKKVEVAHILPHSLMSRPSGENAELNSSKKTALAILDMFDHGVTHLIENQQIDRPFNAISLIHDLHFWFGDFKLCFEPDDNQEHTYRIEWLGDDLLYPADLPTGARVVLSTADPTIDRPSPRLLAIHRAIARIMHMSAAGEYIDQILRDLDEGKVLADGTTRLGQFVALRLDGWLPAQIRAY
ncbi:hypothetical protein DV738_g2137, partial [Chaetothyriales sp. CBS 135597]